MLLPVIASRDSADGQIFVEIRPMKSKGRDLDVIYLLGRALGKTRVLCDRKPERRPSLENDNNMAVAKIR